MKKITLLSKDILKGAKFPVYREHQFIHRGGVPLEKVGSLLKDVVVNKDNEEPTLFVEPQFFGIRAFYANGEMLSSKGVSMRMDKVHEGMRLALKKLPEDYVYDGELVVLSGGKYISNSYNASYGKSAICIDLFGNSQKKMELKSGDRFAFIIRDMLTAEEWLRGKSDLSYIDRRGRMIGELIAKPCSNAVLSNSGKPTIGTAKRDFQTGMSAIAPFFNSNTSSILPDSANMGSVFISPSFDLTGDCISLASKSSSVSKISSALSKIGIFMSGDIGIVTPHLLLRRNVRGVGYFSRAGDDASTIPMNMLYGLHTAIKGSMGGSYGETYMTSLRKIPMRVDDVISLTNDEGGGNTFLVKNKSMFFTSGLNFVSTGVRLSTHALVVSVNHEDVIGKTNQSKLGRSFDTHGRMRAVIALSPTAGRAIAKHGGKSSLVGRYVDVICYALPLSINDGIGDGYRQYSVNSEYNMHIHGGKKVEIEKPDKDIGDIALSALYMDNLTIRYDLDREDVEYVRSKKES